MIQQVVAAGRRAGTPTGIHSLDPRDALRRAEQGMQFIAVGSALWMMNQAVQQTVKTLWPEGVRRALTRY